MIDPYFSETSREAQRQEEARKARGAVDDSFWNWSDAGVFVILLIPSFLFGLVLTNAFFTFAPLGLGATRAVRLMVFQFAIYGIWFVSLWAMFLLRYRKPFWPSMGWLVPWPHIYATMLAGPALVFTVALLGRWMRTPKVESALDKLLSDPLSIAVIGLFAVTLGPLSEELVFRGFFQPLLVRTFGAVWGIVVASLPFALLHGPQYQWSWRHMFLLFLASSAFGVTRWWTGSTAASTLVHCAYNFTFLLGFLLQKKGIIY